jgi:hypothetical protein
MSDKLFTKDVTHAVLDGMHVVVLHDTAIVTWGDKTITLDTGGWWTRLTKDKMNQTSRDFNLGFVVYQEDHKWYVARRIYGQSEFDWDNPIPFVTQTLLLNRRYER